MVMHVATLAANVPHAELDAETVAGVVRDITELYGEYGPYEKYDYPMPAMEWLKPGEVCDVFFSWEREEIIQLAAPRLPPKPTMLRILLSRRVSLVHAAIGIVIGYFIAKYKWLSPFWWQAIVFAYLLFLLFIIPSCRQRKSIRREDAQHVVRRDGHGADPLKVKDLLAQALKGKAIDYIIQPVETKQTRCKKLLISDMDSTMITVECIDELADFVGKKAEVAAITERAMNGELDFEAALTERVALLKGLPESVLQTCYDERVRMMPGARSLVQGMREKGARCVLVSGGFTFFTSRVAEALGFHEHYANELEIENGVLTGRVVPPILGSQAKLATLQAKVKELGITPEDVLAVGDGANDLPMLLAAGLGVAYHAKPSVQAQAQHHVNHGDLSVLAWAEGIEA